jgi:hypothetical protein
MEGIALKRSTIVRLAALAAIALIVLAGVVACRKSGDDQRVTSSWPQADSERVVPKPPAPAIWPLTGEKAKNPKETLRRPVSVKIENSPASRPQTGLNDADIVYESIAEGGITRFNAIFHSNLPETVGPVRSARLSDVSIVPQYDALFYFSGSSTSVRRAVNGANLPNLSEDAGVSRPFFRSSSRSAPHNLYLRFQQAREEAERRGMRVTWKPKPLTFSPSTDSTIAISSVSIPISQANTTSWKYDKASKTYLKGVNGVSHLDSSGEQLRARNMVVLWVDYLGASRDKLGSTTYDIKLVGSGRASLFRDGVRVDGTWEASADGPPVLRAEDGTLIKFAPGNTWFEAVPQSVNITMQ